MSDRTKFPDEKMMTLLGHLNELKDRLIRIVIAWVVFSAAAFVISGQVFDWLILPAYQSETPLAIQAIDPTTTIALFMKISLFTGAIMAMPVIVYQLLRYIMPGLTRQEKRALTWIIPGATILFLVGAALAYLTLVPAAVSYLSGFWRERVQQNWTVDRYIAFVTGLIFWIGVSFQMPLILAFLSRLGIVTARQMLSVWKFALVGIAVLAALITPTPDWFNMTLVMLPLIALYLLGVLLARLVQPKSVGQTAHV